MTEEGHLEHPPEAESGHPEPALQVPVGVGEIIRVQVGALLQHQHLVALFDQSQGADAPPEARSNDQVIPLLLS